jgi:hypothetical protein
MTSSKLRAPLIAAAFLCVSSAAPAAAKPKPISGKLSKPGYTVVALASNGKARATAAKGRNFKLTPPAKKVTLHLRSADGVYAGPIVVATKGKNRALVGVKAGAKLGAIKILKGYAKPKRKLSKRFVDRSATARAKQGVPLGAGLFGRVKTKAAGAAGQGRDQDLDGLPGAFDVDDDGDLVLDNVEVRSVQGARIAAEPLPPVPPGGVPPTGPPAAGGFNVFSNLKLDLSESLNANAGAVTDAQIDAVMSKYQTLAIQVPSGDAELDCGGLSYCSKGGTGIAMGNGGNPDPANAFPDAFDSDGDGFGLLKAGSTGDFQLLSGAKTAAIGSGDAFVERVRRGGVETEVPGILNYVFSTTPALKSWTEGATSGAVTYPVPAGGAGTAANPIPVSATGDVIVAMTFWRPQRKAIPASGEGSDWVDIGRLKYTADVPNAPVAGGPGAPGARGPGNCAASTYSTTDPNLKVGGGGVEDSSADRPSVSANTLTFSVNLTQCLAAAAVTWSSGATLQVDIQARSSFGDNAAQKLSFRRS